MKKLISLAIFSVLCCAVAYSQDSTRSPTTPRPATTSSPAKTQQPIVAQRAPVRFDLSEYGVTFQTEPRLIIMMAALEAAGFDPGAVGTEASVFRAQVRRDLAGLDPDLRNRLRTFYERNKLPAPATAADQAARYVSLAF